MRIEDHVLFYHTGKTGRPLVSPERWKRLRANHALFINCGPRLTPEELEEETERDILAGRVEVFNGRNGVDMSADAVRARRRAAGKPVEWPEGSIDN